jgi:hypothetical protein
MKYQVLIFEIFVFKVCYSIIEIITISKLKKKEKEREE